MKFLALISFVLAGGSKDASRIAPGESSIDKATAISIFKDIKTAIGSSNATTITGLITKLDDQYTINAKNMIKLAVTAFPAGKNR
jgi:hypothetical protein